MFNHNIFSDCFFEALKPIVIYINRKESFFESKSVLSLQTNELFLRVTNEHTLDYGVYVSVDRRIWRFVSFVSKPVSR
jgi:hypothetical protein